MDKVTIKTLCIRGDEEPKNSIISEEINVDGFTKELDMWLRAKGFSPLPKEDIAAFLEKAVENHNKMTRDICAFWCPELQKQV